MTLLSLILFLNLEVAFDQNRMHNLDYFVKVTFAQSQQSSMELPKFKVILHSESGTVSKVNYTTLSLRLDNVDKNTITFSDRPDRIVLTQSVEDFVGNRGLTQLGFENNPPNTVLVLEADEGMKQDVLEIKLFNPKYDGQDESLYYNFTLLGNASSSQLPENFRNAVLIIDDWTIKGIDGCSSYEGCTYSALSDPDLSKCFLIEHFRAACPLS